MQHNTQKIVPSLLTLPNEILIHIVNYVVSTDKDYIYLIYLAKMNQRFHQILQPKLAKIELDFRIKQLITDTNRMQENTLLDNKKSQDHLENIKKFQSICNIRDYLLRHKINDISLLNQAYQIGDQISVCDPTIRALTLLELAALCNQQPPAIQALTNYTNRE